MNWTDYIIIGVLALSVLVGLWRGLVSEVLAMVIWVAAFWVAWTFGPVVADGLSDMVSLPSARIILGYALCFVAVLVLGALLRFVIRRMVHGTGLSGVDRLLGMLFGFARGVLLVALLVFLVGFTAFTRDPWWQQSVLLPQFQHVAAWLGQRVPSTVQQYMHPSAAVDRLVALPGAALPALRAAQAGGTFPAPSATILSPATPAAASSAADPAPSF